MKFDTHRRGSRFDSEVILSRPKVSCAIGKLKLTHTRHTWSRPALLVVSFLVLFTCEEKIDAGK